MLLAPKSIGVTWCPGSIVRMGQLLQELKATHPIDPARIFIHGYSDGGTTALLTAAMNPGLFSAVACIHGIPSAEIGSRAEGKGLKGIRVFACGGGKDPFFPLTKFRSTCAALEKLGCTVKLHERPDAAHSYPSGLNETIAQFLSGGETKADEKKEPTK
jgi:predicted esterase